MVDVFVSYALDDAGSALLAQRLAAVLTSHGLTVRQDEPGSPRGQRGPEVLSRSDGIVLLIGPAELQSAACRRRWSQALEAYWRDPGKTIVPVLIGDVPPPAFVADFTTERLATPAEAGELADRIAATLAAPAPADHEEYTTASARRLIAAATVRRIALSPDGERLATAEGDTVRLWDPRTGTSTGAVSGGGEIHAIAFSPDGRRLAAGGRDAAVRLWDVATLALTGRPEGHQGAVYAVAFSPDGDVLVTAGADAVVRLWDPAAGAPLGALAGHRLPVHAAAFSPAADLLATGDAEGTVRLWSLPAGAAVAELHAGDAQVGAVTFAPDGRLLATCADAVRLWEPSSATPVADLRSAGRAVTFSPDARLLAAACTDTTVRLWEPARTETVVAVLRHGTDVRDVRFAPDGLTLVTADTTGVYRWDVPSAHQRSRLAEVESSARSLKPSDGELLDRMAALEEKLARDRAAPEPDDPAVATTLVRLAVTCRELRQYDRAYAALLQALDVQRRALGPEHPAVGSTLVNIGLVECELGRYAEAQSTLGQALELQRRTLGADHPAIATTLVSLGRVQRRLGRYAEAHATLREALELQRRTIGADHPTVAATLVELAALERALHRPEDAHRTLRQALDLQRRVLGPRHAAVAATLVELAEVSRELGRVDEARALLISAREIVRGGGEAERIAELQESLPRTSFGRGVGDEPG